MPTENLYGFYRGIVLDNRDPSIDKEGKTYGRVKVHIPAIMEEETCGIWAYPGNNPIGGRHTLSISEKKDSNGGKQEYCGCFYVPPNNAAVWIFFENGDSNRPFYIGGLDIKSKEAPPECIGGSKPEERWIVFRSPQGRTIVISDDEENCRIEITGKKSSVSDPYGIKGNQKTILIEDGQNEKILISDQNGNYVNINTKTNDINVNAKNIVRIHADNSIYLDTNYIGMKCSAIGINSNDLDASLGGGARIGGGKVSFTGSAVAFDAGSVSSNCGAADSPGAYKPDPGTNSGDR